MPRFPNPCVGAVLVDAKGKVVGRGTHTYEGRKHAEVLALEAGRRSRPWRHPLRQPRTLLARGTHRPVRRCADCRGREARLSWPCAIPIRWSAGQGLARLRDAGIEVQEGLREIEAKKLNESFAKYIRHKTPFVTLKTAMTLDGKIAPPPGEGATPGALDR